MKKLSVLPAVLVCAAMALVVASVGARASTPVAHAHGAHFSQLRFSDPDPVDCPFCGGNPQVHVRAMWTVEKEVVRLYVMRLL
jgi:hypothetical protein